MIFAQDRNNAHSKLHKLYKEYQKYGLDISCEKTKYLLEMYDGAIITCARFTNVLGSHIYEKYIGNKAKD